MYCIAVAIENTSIYTLQQFEKLEEAIKAAPLRSSNMHFTQVTLFYMLLFYLLINEIFISFRVIWDIGPLCFTATRTNS